MITNNTKHPNIGSRNEWLSDRGEPKKLMRWIVVILAGALSIGALSGRARAAAGPTEENALAAEQEVASALLANDVDAIGRLLTDDWVVISADGRVADRAGFLAVIKSGDFTRKTLSLSDPRVRIYGNVAVVTTQVKTSGAFMGKSFDLPECQTDVL